MLLQTEPGYAFAPCSECNDIVKFPVNIEVELIEQGIRGRVKNLDLQPVYNHKFEQHLTMGEA